MSRCSIETAHGSKWCCWKERGARVSEARQMNTLHTFYSKLRMYMKWFYYLTSFLTDFMHCHASNILSAYTSEKFWKYFSEIYQVISRGYAKRILPSPSSSLSMHIKVHSILRSISEVNQAWNEHEAWVCQGDKNYLRVLKLDNHIIGDNDSVSVKRLADITFCFSTFQSPSSSLVCWSSFLDALL